MTRLYLFASFISLLMAQCEPKITNNERVIIQGKIIDPQDKPIENIEISSNVERYTLGKTTTDENGNFKMVSAESYNDDYVIEVNSNFKQAFSSAYIYREEETNPPEIYNLQEITLEPLSKLTFEINKTSSNNSRVEFEINFVSYQCRYFISDELNKDTSFCFEEVNLNRTKPSNEANYSRNFTVLKNFPITITYQIDDNPEVTATFTPDSQNYSYEITY